MSSISTFYQRMTYVLVVSTFFLIMLGGYVKAIGAGLACPDWPLCYGKLFPFLDGGDYEYAPFLIFVEWFHRLWASLVGFLLIGLVYESRKYMSDTPLLFKLGMVCLILFAVQVLLGGLTVKSGLNELVVVLHLANAVLIIMVEMSIAFVATVSSS